MPHVPPSFHLMKTAYAGSRQEWALDGGGAPSERDYGSPDGHWKYRLECVDEEQGHYVLKRIEGERIMNKGHSGKSYHVKKAQSQKKKRKKELKKQIREAIKQRRDPTRLRILLALED